MKRSQAGNRIYIQKVSSELASNQILCHNWPKDYKQLIGKQVEKIWNASIAGTELTLKILKELRQHPPLNFTKMVNLLIVITTQQNEFCDGSPDFGGLEVLFVSRDPNSGRSD